MGNRETQKRVLVVDDEAELRASLRLILERAGYQVSEAAGGTEALDLFAQQPADVVVVDLWMPGKDGVETILDFSETYPGLKIVAMTGAATGRPGWIEPAKLMGATIALEKPFEPEQLLAAIEKLLNQK